VAELVREPWLLAAQTAMLPPPRRRGIDPIDATLVLARAKLEEADALDDAVRALSPPELSAVLGDAAALGRLSALANGD
jgi:membrane glycosyltransferase